MTRFASLAATALTAAAALAFVSPAAAQTSGDPGMTTYRETVRFADLDLNTQSGAEALAHRLEGSVEYVCGGEPTSASESGALRDYRACRRATMSAVVARVGSPRLTATVEGRRLLQLAAK